MPILESGEEATLVGGQAVIEGVMMRAPHSYCVAVRKSDGSIVTTEQALPRLSDKYPIFKYPIFRGLGTLGQAMALGTKALKFSGDVSLEDEQEKEARKAAAAAPQAADPVPPPTAHACAAAIPHAEVGPCEAQRVAEPAPQAAKKPMEIPAWALGINIAISLAFFIITSKYLPLYFATRLKDVFPALGSIILFNLAEGVIRTLILVLFMFAISLTKDIHRVFEFHGAEHKVVFNFESGQPVTVENAQRFTTFHPRCGTSFLFVIIIVSVLFYTFIPYQDFWRKLLCRIALLPPIVGVSYELIRFAAKRRGSALAMLTAPGLWLQRITTKPPADDQTAVAIRALEGAMALEQQQGGELVIS